MGTVEYTDHGQLLISSHIITYGSAADTAISEQIREEIETMWNGPHGTVLIKGESLSVVFHITCAFTPAVSQEEILGNTDPRNNYFRIEEFALEDISFVDGIGSNTGYFKLANLYPGSTTAAHEYGHTIGLAHPDDIDLRGKGIPGIMYPRGTLVDSFFQYNPNGASGDRHNGGTMHPRHRKVLQSDIDLLRLQRLDYRQGKAVLGEFSSIWHPNHAEFR